MPPDILVIGAVLWDIIGRAPQAMALGADVPGRILRHPGGVALNIALALRRLGSHPALVGVLGNDAEGDDLLRACTAQGLDLSMCLRHDHPTDCYMAIEGANGLIAAVADAHGLELAGRAVLAPMRDWTKGAIVLDGNLTEEVLAEVAADPAHAERHILLAPASPGKALRLRPFLTRPHTTLYLNREEAALLAGRALADAAEAARALHDQGVAHVLVTDGARPVAEARDGVVLLAETPKVAQARVTGAGDMFMSAHIVASAKGRPRATALALAAQAAARHVSGEDATKGWIDDAP